MSNVSPLLGLKNIASKGPEFLNKSLTVQARALWNSSKKGAVKWHIHLLSIEEDETSLAGKEKTHQCVLAIY
jgi:hypothetical protein